MCYEKYLNRYNVNYIKNSKHCYLKSFLSQKQFVFRPTAQTFFYRMLIKEKLVYLGNFQEKSRKLKKTNIFLKKSFLYLF